jgi:hypothetical protein
MSQYGDVLRKVIVTIICCVAASTLHAQNPGGVPIRIDDGTTPRCVDSSKDKVWLTLRRLITTRKVGWFVKDNDVAVIINAQVKTDPQADKALTFPLTANVKFGDASGGQVSLPIEYPIVTGLKLTQDTVTYTGIGVEVTLVNAQDTTKLGTAIQALAKVTSSSKLPIPASPYIAGAGYVLNFANQAISDDLSKTPDKSVAGALSFNFDPDGSCTSGDFETTGTKAIVYGEGVAGDGFIDIQHTDKYCFSASLTPVFTLRVAKKQATLACSDPSYSSKMVDVSNNYIGFFLNKRTSTPVTGPTPLSQRDREESLRRCQSNGVSAIKCLAESN